MTEHLLLIRFKLVYCIDPIGIRSSKNRKGCCTKLQNWNIFEVREEELPAFCGFLFSFLLDQIICTFVFLLCFFFPFTTSFYISYLYPASFLFFVSAEMRKRNMCIFVWLYEKEERKLIFVINWHHLADTDSYARSYLVNNWIGYWELHNYSILFHCCQGNNMDCLWNHKESSLIQIISFLF